MTTPIDSSAIILALIPTVGAVLTAYVTARVQTKHAKNSDQAKQKAVKKAVERGDLTSEDISSENKYAFKISTRKLLFRTLLAVGLAILSIFIGVLIEEQFIGMSGEFMLIPFVIFLLVGAYFLFRFVYRLFWLAFVS